MKKTIAAKERPAAPELAWQTGEYSRDAAFKFLLPYQFLLLCKLVEMAPEDMIHDFMDNLSCGSWKREGRAGAKACLVDYFIAHGYGKQYYSEEEIRQIFQEMDAIGMLFPVDGNSELLDRYTEWRNEHHQFWFDKWFSKPGRQPAAGQR